MIAVGIGANVGTVSGIVERFRGVRQQLGGRRSAALYRTAPIGLDQADFLNTAVLLDDAGEPDALLAWLHAIEALHGRDRARELQGGPRTLDLDVLLWEGRVIATSELVVPHPRLRERRFALLPVADLLGEPWRTFAEVPGIRDQRVELVAATW
jgi:2-amino-4-hydroxy-6-hydroxymethyldihydropteridine diphosphokinase